MIYNKEWTKEEVMSMAYGILRKQLYPAFLVRWNVGFPDISIWKAEVGTDPVLKVVVVYQKHTATLPPNTPFVVVDSKEDAYKIVSKVLSLA